MTAPGPGVRPLDRLLGLVTVVHPGEGPTALLLAANVFLLLTSYYVIKPVREALILAADGAEVKSYAAAGQAVLLLVLVPLYGSLADRLPRRRLLNAVTAFFVACLLGFALLARAGVPVGVPFFLWVGIFNLMVVAQFWAFANDLYTRDQGERLFPVVAFGASVGAVAGSAVAGGLIPLVGVPALLPVAAVLLVLATLLGNVADARERARCEAGMPPALTTAEIPAATGEYLVEEAGPAEERVTVSLPGASSRRGPFRLVLGNRYLLGIALLLLMVNWVNTTGEYLLGRTVAAAAEQAVAAGTAGGLDAGGFIGAFYSRFFLWVNVVGLLLQLFVVARLVRWAGVRRAVLVLPLLALAGYLCLVFLPALAVIRWVKTAENATDYSLQNTVRNMLFLPTTREQKYKAKQAIDGFFVRAGDVLSALSVYLGTTWLGFGVSAFAVLNLALGAVWLVLAAATGRGYARLAARAA